MAETLGVFRCLVITPKEKVLDTKTCSVVLPAHDGQVGILRNHMPMLVELGLGIMELRRTPHEECAESGKTYFLIDGGFARVNNDVLTVLAYDVTAGSDLKPEDIAKLKAKIQASPAQPQQIADRQARKDALTLQLASLSQESKPAGH